MISAETYAHALFQAVIETNPKDHEKVLDKFVNMLAANGDLSKYDQIEAVFRKLDADHRGVKQVDVITAHGTKLDKSMIEKLNESLSANIEVRHKIDNQLIGGVVIRMEDTLIDASIKGNLDKLKKSMSGELNT